MNTVGDALTRLNRNIDDQERIIIKARWKWRMAIESGLTTHADRWEHIYNLALERLLLMMDVRVVIVMDVLTWPGDYDWHMS